MNESNKEKVLAWVRECCRETCRCDFEEGRCKRCGITSIEENPLGIAQPEVCITPEDLTLQHLLRAIVESGNFMILNERGTMICDKWSNGQEYNLTKNLEDQEDELFDFLIAFVSES